MKKLVGLSFSLLLAGLTWAQNDPVIMTVNGQKIYKSEFLQSYLKNNDSPSYAKDSLELYAKRYSDFKLKVAEAEAMGLDTIPAFVKELQGYERQLALPYLVDSAQNEILVKEAYDRMQKEIRASHILIRVGEDASPHDTLKAYNRIINLRRRILSGEDFASVANSKFGSEDPSVAQNNGDLGYFTAFQMVYPFENAAYNTPEGEVSMPVRTKFGYHILKITDVRDARGTISAAHILVLAQKEEELQAAKNKIDSIYAKLERGEDWSTLARKYSDDQSSRNKGGLLPDFGSRTKQRMVPVFEDEAFALTEDGQYSKPFKTQFGYHIVRRVSWKPLPSYEEMERELYNKVNRDMRGQQTQASFVEKLKKEYNFTAGAQTAPALLKGVVDSSLFEGTWKFDGTNADAVIFNYANKDYTLNDFASFLENTQRKQPMKNVDDFVAKVYTNWERTQIIAYEESQLKNKYPAYKHLMQEYHDGILLYEIMKDEVWDKASKDTLGLKNYYQAHREDYILPNRLNANVFELYNKKDAKKAYKMLKKGASMADLEAEFGSESDLRMRADSLVMNTETDERIKNESLSLGLNKAYEANGKYYVVVVNEELPSRPKTYKEAKGAIIQDYQTQLEKAWLEELRKKHDIVINKEVLFSLGS
ncbi:peptidylprolyl isomerase [Lishizhenia sp.]|uniref:peptidylprolyl isomerase n=1 Tax=Lishizhenia sp. TaxID=2497594 RepID=UPI00299D5BA8|nr:peptidylprolyl isomerase [Lishizhenia sp.]MDX1445640.1 peptidylprolyl isomerase [Lishizhenia sp.]